ncbi:MAG: hypothetical protein IJT74_01785 [Bacteroidales bacterium]|nr:hypothetical protein [Bacteroidales bacterium]
MKLILALLAVLGVLPVYKDPSAPETKRVEDLLSRMTLHEKVMQLNQYTIGRNGMQKKVMEESRSGGNLAAGRERGGGPGGHSVRTHQSFR